MRDFPLTITEFRRPARGEPKVVAVYSFRYDASLVPDLVENIRPFVHAAVALDDRGADVTMSDEPPRRAALHAAARAAGADWILAVDPDERFEPALARLMPALTAPTDRPILWRFRFRELFSMEAWRSDGVWGGKTKVILYPAETTLKPTKETLHGAWIRYDPRWIYVDSGLNLYHLRHISPRRADHRRETYAAVDPGRLHQAIGYDYLSDLRAACYDPIPANRRFLPDRQPDDGLWAVTDTAKIGRIDPDPLDCRLNRIISFRQRAGAAQAAHVTADLAAASPGDDDLRLVAAALHLRGQDPHAALAILPQETSDEPFFASWLRGRAHLALGDPAAARKAADRAPIRLLAALGADANRERADFTAPDSLWRAHDPGGLATIAEGARNGTGPLSVVVISHNGGPSPRDAVASVAAQSDATEIVLVRSGDPELPDLGPLNDRVRRIAIATPLFVGAARNIGICASRGEILAFLAGDCRIEPGWTEGRLARHEAGALSVSTPVLPERPGTLIGHLTARHGFARRDPWMTQDLASHYGRSYARSLFAEVGLFIPGLRVIEDTEFNARVDAVARPVWAPEIAVRHKDPQNLVTFMADLRRRADRGATYGHSPGGPQPDWIERRMALHRVIVDRVAADDPEGPPGWFRQRMGALANRARALGLADADKRLRAAAAAYRAASALLPTRPAEAAAGFAKAASLMPQMAAYHTAQARAHKAAGEPEAAVTAFETALALAPGDGQAVEAMVKALIELDRSEQAHARAEALTVLAPDSYLLARAAAEAAIAAGRPRIALFHAHRALAINVARPENHLLVERFHIRTGATALADCRRRMAEDIRAAADRRAAAGGRAT